MPKKMNPGWALDPKTKMELKIRENIRKLPAEHGGKLYDPEVEEAIKNKSVTLKDAGKINAIQEMMRKEKEYRGNFNEGKLEQTVYEHKRHEHSQKPALLKPSSSKEEAAEKITKAMQEKE